MDIEDPLQRLCGLKRDLSALVEQRLPHVARLTIELDASIEDFKRLLDKKGKDEDSRKVLTSGNKITLDGTEYRINDVFKSVAIQVSDELDLDEIEAVKLCIASSTGGLDDDALPYKALLRFHQLRATMLECLRLIFEQYIDPEEGREEDKVFWFERTEAIVKASSQRTGLWEKCVAGLGEVEGFLKKLAAHQQTLVMTGVGVHGQRAEAIEAQRILLTAQHEALVGTLALLAAGDDYVNEMGFKSFVNKCAALEAPVDVTYHYLPVLVVLAARFGGNQYQTQAGVAHDLHKLFSGSGRQQWKQKEFGAAARVVWLAEYSARFVDTLTDPALRVSDRQKAEQERSDLFMGCLRERALHFILGACKFLKPEVWHDPAKLGLVNFLLADGPAVSVDAPHASAEFVNLAMCKLQDFAVQFVTNMPDAVRRLKAEEDDRRRLKFTAGESDRYEPDLERFIVIVAYSVQDDPEAAREYWSDKEGIQYGFLRWLSQRLPTPRVAAFCELLRAIANDAGSANQAHRFLLEDSAMVGGRLRKTYGVSWAQIFAELETYAASLREKPATTTSFTKDEAAPSVDFVEGVETSIMLESYLRLAAHIIRTSPDARNWLLREQTFHIGELMFQLASSGIEGRIQASCFNMLSAMLTDKVQEVNDGCWVMLDNWISGGGPADALRPQAPVRIASERHYLQRFNDKPEIATAFVSLLTALIAPSPSQAGPTLDSLPFPENLGAPNRHAGIDVYIDFAIGTVFRLSPSPVVEGLATTEGTVLRYACLDLIYTCLTTFNENLVILANATDVAVDATIKASSLATYVRLHPFARVMEWMFNDNVAAALFDSARWDLNSLDQADENSPMVQTAWKSIQVMNLILDLQTTYLDIVRPMIKMQTLSRSDAVSNSAFASFNDLALTHLSSLGHMISYLASRHVILSLESITLFRKVLSSSKLTGRGDDGSGGKPLGSRLVSTLSHTSDATSSILTHDFSITEPDIELGEEPLKVLKSRALLDMLTTSIDTSPSPSIAHSLLGFNCTERSVAIAPHSAFEEGASLFHSIVICAASTPSAVAQNNLSWLLSLKRGCLSLILKLSSSPLTAEIVKNQLQAMEPLAMLSKTQPVPSLFDGRVPSDLETLLTTSAAAVMDFFSLRELYFQFSSLDIKLNAEGGVYSNLESAASILQGTILFPDGESEATHSIFDLFDFLEVETLPPYEITPHYLKDIDLSVCLREGKYDLQIAEQLFILHTREVKGDVDPQAMEDEIQATLASLRSWNSWRGIDAARGAALSAWTDLVTLLLTTGTFDPAELEGFALRALQITLPHLEKSLGEEGEAATQLAGLVLELVPAVKQESHAARERLLAAFRVSLKAITASDDLSLRETSYRICSIIPKSAHTKQLHEILRPQIERVVATLSQDVGSVAALLFLDAAISIHQATTTSTPKILKLLEKTNLVGVLVDSSLSSAPTLFQDQREISSAMAYFQTAMVVLLRICVTAEGSSLVFNSGFFEAVRESGLFSTDPELGDGEAVKLFYGIMGAVLRVIVAVVMTGNNKVREVGRVFLTENRAVMVGVFKRESKGEDVAGIERAV
ncbi:hypothetical protein K470DRAFT_298163 [Piedraia hortae CBS 480.64]|uniref:Nucleoporin Nup186/Nup192/Nup205 n=1 Tax=Piedraia hortae CBS 480.64 TaxID=1314780 RepID=A0A6A7C946_9PEZI|nr:hypothetical protein K470DRAFT_298163 [Piedraia hortae CBS 480.64]